MPSSRPATSGFRGMGGCSAGAREASFVLVRSHVVGVRRRAGAPVASVHEGVQGRCAAGRPERFGSGADCADEVGVRVLGGARVPWTNTRPVGRMGRCSALSWDGSRPVWTHATEPRLVGRP